MISDLYLENMKGILLPDLTIFYQKMCTFICRYCFIINKVVRMDLENACIIEFKLLD